MNDYEKLKMKRRAERDGVQGRLSDALGDRRASHESSLVPQTAGPKAVQYVREMLGSYHLPSKVKLSYAGIRSAKMASAGSQKIDSGVVTVHAEFRSPTGANIPFEIPLEIRGGKFLDPAIIVQGGVPKILAQSSFDELVEHHSTYFKPQSRAMFSPPDARQADTPTYQRINRGMFNTASARQVLRHALLGKAASLDELEAAKTPKTPKQPGKHHNPHKQPEPPKPAPIKTPRAKPDAKRPCSKCFHAPCVCPDKRKKKAQAEHPTDTMYLLDVISDETKPRDVREKAMLKYNTALGLPPMSLEEFCQAYSEFNEHQASRIAVVDEKLAGIMDWATGIYDYAVSGGGPIDVNKRQLQKKPSPALLQEIAKASLPDLRTKFQQMSDQMKQIRADFASNPKDPGKKEQFMQTMADFEELGRALRAKISQVRQKLRTTDKAQMAEQYAQGQLPPERQQEMADAAKKEQAANRALQYARQKAEEARKGKQPGAAPQPKKSAKDEDPRENYPDDLGGDDEAFEFLDPAERMGEDDNLNPGDEVSIKEEITIPTRGGPHHNIAKGTKCVILRDADGGGTSFHVKFNDHDGIEAFVPRKVLKSGAMDMVEAVAKEIRQMKHDGLAEVDIRHAIRTKYPSHADAAFQKVGE